MLEITSSNYYSSATCDNKFLAKPFQTRVHTINPDIMQVCKSTQRQFLQLAMPQSYYSNLYFYYQIDALQNLKAIDMIARKVKK